MNKGLAKLFLILLIVTSINTSSYGATLDIVIHSPIYRGHCLNLALFNSKAAYSAGNVVNAWYAVKQVMTAPTTHMIIGSLPEGYYVAAAFTDVACKGAMKHNFFGVPTSPYGFSNNVTGAFGSKPSYSHARIYVGKQTAKVEIQLK